MRRLALVASVSMLLGCTVGHAPMPGHDAAADPDGATHDAGVVACPHMVTTICDGANAITCAADGTRVGYPIDCTMHGGLCVAGVGCASCLPGVSHCDASGASVACRGDGSGYLPPVTCDAAAGESCNTSTGMCSSPCQDAATHHSYVGCEYWPTPAINTYLHRDQFEFAVAVANPNDVSASVHVTRGATDVVLRDVAPHTLETIVLPWIPELEGGVGSGTADPAYSAIVDDGAYHLVSTLPITVYQFNALEYENSSMGFSLYSYSNDASLVLPVHALTGNYIVISRPSNYIETVLHNPTSGDAMNTVRSPGFFAVVAVDGHASVSVHFTANVLASIDGTSVRAFHVGDTGSFSLTRGQVLQVLTDTPPTCNRIAMETQTFPGGTPPVTQDAFYCEVGPEYDLTGTSITATGGRVELVSGHNCDFVPFDRWACDHLEQVMFPLEAWGHEAIFSVSQPIRGEPNLARVVSGHDANTITFEPASVHAPVTLNAGEFIEFEVHDHFRATGTSAFQIAQFMVGQDYAGLGTSGMDADGDPSMSLVIPAAQYRTQYTFLAPSTYAQSYVNITAPDGVDVTLDGALVDPSTSGGWTEVGTTGTRVARIPIEGGVHEITSTAQFGIVVYGFGRYTSYMYPGGLDLAPINPLI